MTALAWFTLGIGLQVGILIGAAVAVAAIRPRNRRSPTERTLIRSRRDVA